jgi:hypothetical protein
LERRALRKKGALAGEALLEGKSRELYDRNLQLPGRRHLERRVEEAHASRNERERAIELPRKSQSQKKKESCVERLKPP